jgi:hypothetical protein
MDRPWNERPKGLLFSVKASNGLYRSLLAARMVVRGTSFYARMKIILSAVTSYSHGITPKKYRRSCWWELITGMFYRLPTNVRSQSHIHETTNLMRLLVKLDSVRCIASDCQQVPDSCRWGHATIFDRRKLLQFATLCLTLFLCLFAFQTAIGIGK